MEKNFQHQKTHTGEKSCFYKVTHAEKASETPSYCITQNSHGKIISLYKELRFNLRNHQMEKLLLNESHQVNTIQKLSIRMLMGKGC